MVLHLCFRTLSSWKMTSLLNLNWTEEGKQIYILANTFPLYICYDKVTTWNYLSATMLHCWGGVCFHCPLRVCVLSPNIRWLVMSSKLNVCSVLSNNCIPVIIRLIQNFSEMLNEPFYVLTSVETFFVLVIRPWNLCQFNILQIVEMYTSVPVLFTSV